MHITPLSENKDFRLQHRPTPTFARNGQNCWVRSGNVAPWDLRRHLYAELSLRPTELGNPHQTRVPTFPQRLRRRYPLWRESQPPLKSRVPSDSCTEPEIEGSKVLMFHAKDDPNVPYERTRLFAELTGATLKSLIRGGHISTDYVVRRYWVQIKNFFESA